MNRIFFTLKKFWKNRYILAQYLSNPAFQAKNIYQLSLKDIKKQGIEVLVLDYDGVLAPHGVNELEPKVLDWLKRCSDIFGEGRVYVLSNKATMVRKEYFREQLPGIIFFKATRKKPYPDGLSAILSEASIQSKEMLVVDDRLFTGILAAVLVGAQGIFITKPTIDFFQHGIQESAFVFLRLKERALCWFFKK